MRVIPQKFIANDGTEFDNEAAALAHEAALVKLGMQQWNFSYQFKRELRDEYKPTYKECSSCHGGGRIGGGFGDPDGPRDCPTCYGAGQVIDKKPVVVEAPAIPDDLRIAMAETWNKWWADFEANHGTNPNS